MQDTITLIIQLLISIIPVSLLVVELVKYVKLSVKEKNWKQLVQLINSLVIEAEKLYTDGVEKEDYVVKMTMYAAEKINYEITEEEVREFVRNLIAVTNVVNIDKSSEISEDVPSEN